MGMLHQAVTDQMAGSGGLILHAHVHLAGLNGDGVITHREADADVADIVTGLGVSTVGIGAVLGSFHRDIVETHIMAEEGMEVPGCGIPAQNTVEGNVFAMIEEYQTGAGNFTCLGVQPPAGSGSISVDDAPTHDSNILSMEGGNEAAMAGVGVALPHADHMLTTGLGIGNRSGHHGPMLLAGVTQQNRALLEFQRHVRLKDKGTNQISTGRNHHTTALGTVENRVLNGIGIISDAIAHRAKITDVDTAGLRLGHKCKGVLPYRYGILRTGLQIEQGENIGAHAPKGGRTIHSHIVLALSIIRGRILQFKACRYRGNI